MTQNLFIQKIAYLRLLGIVLLCVAYTIPMQASRRQRIRQKKQELAMLAQDAEKSIAEQLGIPQQDLSAQIDVTPTESDNAAQLQITEPVATVDDEGIQIIDVANATQADADQTETAPDKIELYFQDASLENFADQVEDIFDVTFIYDDAIDPLPQNGKSLKGHKISYRTIVPISRTEVWNTFNTFLNIAGLALAPHTNERTYRITSINTAQKLPLPTYIGTDSTTLPDSNELIRYVYFIENSTIDAISAIVSSFSSSASAPLFLREHKAFILTDIAYNIKKLMEIVRELDKVSMPESVSVLKLKQADAKEVKDLYDALTQKKDQPQQPFGPQNRRTPEALALPENVTIITDPRTNSLILIGPQQARERLEQFIIKNIDVELDQAYSPLHTYQLRYANAETIAKIMNDVTRFGADTPAGKSGGVRGGDQYMRPISFVAEPATNRLVIKGHYDDYLKAVEVIKTLDVDQPQVAIEILILSIDIRKQKQLGAQIRSKAFGGTDGLLGKNVKFQTSGLFAQGADFPSGIQQNFDSNAPGIQRLLGNLLNVVVGAPAGNTIITLGEDIYGVWGILQLLETVSNVQLVSNPFLIATNNTQAVVELGQTRRVATATALAASGNQQNIDAIGEDAANLVVKVTPQINSDGMIVLDLDIQIDNFTSNIISDPTKNTKNIKTFATLANKQVLALGGLVRNAIDTRMSKTPWLGDIPILGWFFKNKSKQEDKQNLLILVSTRLVEPKDVLDLEIYNKKHTDEYRGNVDALALMTQSRDPIHNIFFKEKANDTDKMLDHFLFERKKGGSSRLRRLKKRRAEEALAQQQAVPQQPNNTPATQIASAAQITKPAQPIAKQPTQTVATAPKPVVQKQNTAIAQTATRTTGVQNKVIAQSHPQKQHPIKTDITAQRSDAQPITAQASTSAQDLKSVLRTKKRTNLALTELLSEKQGALS